MFCKKCGSLLMPRRENGKVVMSCSCGYTEAGKDTKMKESGKSDEKIDVVEKDEQNLPVTEAECPKCGNKEAYYWLIQTRASDEPETKFLKCTKCSHTWRDYS